ncbi:hypothetical protein GobsT_71360 [Gemmata obscuriglobus]|uniref:Uncharacterized protein n=1 Tax=Gemmata obscuriglobus TaxID=114 RepID=A0A2Z3HA51_9BACT|nr:hypothetical protein [Gemmata obscuriglobus]AWM41761.1 hypothetical protein C1280_35375 [Gemmata obscuriglobus]QEG32283.1 hypothetical protein GobsT_71360 [Gemmata obscuriglobus]VTS11639.1 unnamed protein product [Gemmata obscuriglobus UQM 2246]
MADPWAEAFANIGADFEQLMAPLLAPVTVTRADADAGTAVTTVAAVPALKRGRRRQPFGVGGGGDVGSDATRFVIKADRVTWALKAKDTITEASGTVWVVTDLEQIAMGQVYTANVVIKR